MSSPTPGSRWQRMVRRLTASEQQLEAERLQHEAAESGCALACDVKHGDLVHVTGRLRTVVYTPRTNLPTLEAELYDGSGTVTLVWLGRRRIAGIEPGRTVSVRGRVARQEDRCIIYNPYYELTPSV